MAGIVLLIVPGVTSILAKTLTVMIHVVLLAMLPPVNLTVVSPADKAVSLSFTSVPLPQPVNEVVTGEATSNPVGRLSGRITPV